jgi:hypothetical protein
MKKIFLSLLFILVVNITFAQKNKGKNGSKENRVSSENRGSKENRSSKESRGSKDENDEKEEDGQKHGNHMENKKLRHVVIFKFKDSATADQVKGVEDAFRALPSKIKQIKGYEWGLNNSPENLAQGFTHCFFLTFKSEEDRSIYLPHPDHKAFADSLGPILDKVLVFDYWVKE